MKPDRVVVVLSGGGMKTMAHVGVLRALEQAGIRPSEIVAVSAGAMVGAMFAGGTSYEDVVRRVTTLGRRDIAVVNRFELLVKGVGARSLLKTGPLRALLERLLPVREFDELILPLRIAVTDLDAGALEVFGARGRTDAALAEVVMASMALPLYLPPVVLGGRACGDGGLLQVLPLGLVDDADLVVASDVGPVPAAHPAWRTLSPPLVALSDRALAITMADQKARTLAAWHADDSRPPLVLVEPAVDPYGTFSFDHTVDSIEAGFRAAHAALRARGILQ